MNNGFYEFSRGKQETTSSVFPYTGSAIITGSLDITGLVGVTGSLSQGSDNTASGSYSHAEGNSTQAIGNTSHAEGNSTQAIGYGSHAEGLITNAIGEFSHAEGTFTQAIGNYSHTEGIGTVASGSLQHVQGRWNIPSPDTSAFIIGNGEFGSESNLLFASGTQVQITGSLRVSGSITGSLFGTSSFAISSSRAVTSSFAISASWAPSQTVNTGSLVTTSSFNVFTSSYNTGSFTGSFTGDGSGLTNLPVQSVNTGSFATTGSNTFIGNQVITGSLNITGSITATTYSNLQNSLKTFNRTEGVYLFEDFMGSNAGSVGANYSGVITGASGNGTARTLGFATATQSGRTNQQGVIQHSTGTGASNFAGYSLGNSSLMIGTGTVNIETYVNVQTLSTSLERFFVYFGYAVPSNWQNSSNAIFFSYDEGGVQYFAGAATPNWKCYTRNGVSTTLTTTSIPVVVDQWYKLRININAAASTVTFYIDGTLVATHNTNIPSSGTAMSIVSLMNKTIGTSARTMLTDYFMYEEIFTNPR